MPWKNRRRRSKPCTPDPHSHRSVDDHRSFASQPQALALLPMTTSPRPRLVDNLSELRQILAAVRRDGHRIGLVPTMGALHEGHLSLVRAAQAECEFTVVTIYVNPSQFGPAEDYRRYPRTLSCRSGCLARVGADVVFAPANEEVYPPAYSTWVEVGGVAQPVGGRVPAHPFPRRGHDRAQALQHGRRRRRLFRPEGLPAGPGRAAHGGRS